MKSRNFIASSESLSINWFKSRAMVPLPYLLPDKNIRVFITFCDNNSVGRIGSLDLSCDDLKIIKFSDEPLISNGPKGSFSELGVVSSSLLKIDKFLYLFYSAYSKAKNFVGYKISCGYGVSENDGESFKNLSNYPLLDFDNNEKYIRSSPLIIQKRRNYYMYYQGSINSALEQRYKKPIYGLKCMISDSIYNWADSKSKTVLHPDLASGELGITRGSIFFDKFKKLNLLYSSRSSLNQYQIRHATCDGLNQLFTRSDQDQKIIKSTSDWDYEMQAFPSLIKLKDRNIIFYSGNNFGGSGFGYSVSLLPL